MSALGGVKVNVETLELKPTIMEVRFLESFWARIVIWGMNVKSSIVIGVVARLWSGSNNSNKKNKKVETVRP